MKICLQQIKAEIKEIEAELKNQESIRKEEMERKRQESDPMTSINAELMRMISANKNVKLSVKELEKLTNRLDELEEYKDLKAE